MVDNNNDNFICWNWETTNGTAIITLATSTSYLFGNYDKDIRISPPNIDQKLSEIWTHQYKNPTLSKGPTEFLTWKHQFHANNAIPEMMFLGDPTDATPDTIVIKQTGLKHSFTARWEYKGGTNPRRVQSVGNYAVGYYGRAGIDIPNLVELTMAWQKMETEADRVALTTLPVYIEAKEQSYFGLTEVLWDYGEAGEADWVEVFEVEWNQTQEFTESKTSKTTQLIYPHSYSSVDISFHAVLNQNEQWEDYIARSIKDCAIKMTKPEDPTKYKQIIFRDVQITNVVDTHIAHDGKVLAIIKAKASKFDVNFIHEGDNFSTYYPGYS